MTRYVAVWSLKRGIVDPPEPLDDAGQHAANLEAQNDAQEAYRSVRYELDPPLTTEQEWMEELGRRTFPNQTRAIAHNERMENMPEITEARLKELIEAEEKLSALENMGVDNWEGYSDAMSELREYRASKKEGEK